MTESNEFSENLCAMLLTRIREGRLVLPVLPKVAIQIEQSLKDADVDLRKISLILERDPVLTAQILRLANSAAFRRKQKVETIEKAVTMIGELNIRKLLLAAATQQIFSSKIPRVSKTLHRLWEHSLTVALFSQEIAITAHSTDSEAAYLSGLLHDVGKPIIAIYLLEVERSLLDRGSVNKQNWMEHDDWVKIVENIHRPVSLELIKMWDLPESVSVAVGSFDRDYDRSNPNSLANVLRFANALTISLGICVGDVDTSEISTILRTGQSVLGMDDDFVAHLSEKGKEIEAESVQ